MNSLAPAPVVYFQPQAKAAGVPAWLNRAVQIFEGGLAPNQSVIDSNGKPSVGPYQINTAGQGSGYTAQQLQGSPALQAKIAIPPISDAYKEGTSKGLSGFSLFLYTLSHSGHPTSGGYSSLSPSDQQSVAKRALAAYTTVLPEIPDIIPGPSTKPATTEAQAGASGGGTTSSPTAIDTGSAAGTPTKGLSLGSSLKKWLVDILIALAAFGVIVLGVVFIAQGGGSNNGSQNNAA